MEQNVHATYYLLPSALFVTKQPHHVTTILGSCVAVCLYDIELGYGGINHFMLPLWNGRELASPKYGNVAIRKLFDKMLEMGCRRENIIAKVFGGGDILNINLDQFNIGERNIEIARESLRELNIRITGESVGGTKGRKIVFDTKTGMVNMKYIEKSQ